MEKKTIYFQFYGGPIFGYSRCTQQWKGFRRGEELPEIMCGNGTPKTQKLGSRDDLKIL